MTKPRYRLRFIKTVRGEKIKVTGWINPFRTDTWQIKKGDDVSFIFNDQVQGVVFYYSANDNPPIREFCNLVKLQAFKRRILKISA